MNFTVKINDGFCEWEYKYDNPELCIQDFANAIENKLNLVALNSKCISREVESSKDRSQELSTLIKKLNKQIKHLEKIERIYMFTIDKFGNIVQKY